MSRSPASASVLLVDIGNTRIKWAWWRAGRLGRYRAETYAGWSSEDFARNLFESGRAQRGRAPARIIVANVSDESILARLSAGAQRAGRQPDPVTTLEVIETSRRAAGVVTRYREPWRLGVDRFLAVIAAHHLAGSRGACVINVGTAVTLDLVDGRGVHRGGAIVPGPQLMIESLLRRTAGIARRADAVGRAVTRSASFVARDTATAIEQGAAIALAGAVERAIADSRRELAGAAPLLLLTGGGAGQLRRLLRIRCIEVPDLVLRGIALHAGLALR